MDNDELQSVRIRRLARFGLNTADSGRLVSFYEQAFDGRIVASDRFSDRHVVTLALGDSTLEFTQFDQPGRSYPHDLAPFEAAFQHLAIVVADLPRACGRLSEIVGWTAISTGPQRLPARSGGVNAFKFRDPDGHPLELLNFPDDQLPPYWRSPRPDRMYLGVDHSALSVIDLNRSRRFYEDLGLTLAHQSLNVGMEQQLLDGILNPRVDVMALAPARSTPHVELLHYRDQVRGSRDCLRLHDIAATRLIFELEPPDVAGPPHRESIFQDPDGHFIQLTRGGGNC